MRREALLFFALIGLADSLIAQQLGNLDARTVKPKSFVVFSAEAQSVVAGKPSLLELHFRVLDGFHVNSHRPKSELLIATQIALQPAVGVKMGAAEYPAGMSYHLGSAPDETLDVYTGAFMVEVPVTAEPGEHTMEGTLRYQACDRAACYPPKILPLQVIFTAKQ